ncbi:MAG: 5-methyltetrahydropteroyltriglutamate--homocysteine S-methyltransferase [Candidatus Omnitrophica bacterium]|nr:5-methyltetrahydropteroyltriglutamate--homocysteine S-methyltransferase [Candidatus Omnitrophota bacterium]
MQTYAYGFPRLGRNREFKKITESLWKRETSKEEFKKALDGLEEDILSIYDEFVDKYPVGEMTKYDKMLDTACMLGIYEIKEINEYYQLCRGKNALELTKWFNTNYHYLVPDFSQINDNFLFKQVNFEDVRRYKKYKKGIPYIIGPFTFLKLSKGISSGKFKSFLLALSDVYRELADEFEEIHIDEPAFCLELPNEEIELIKKAYNNFKTSKCKIYLFTYYDSVDFLKELYDLPIYAIGLDFVQGKENIDYIKKYGFPDDKVLIAGIVNGRNIWRTNIKERVAFLEEISSYARNIIISNASPLYHLPVTVEGESLDEKLIKRIAFARERLQELRLISIAFEGDWQLADKWNEETGVFGKDDNVRGRIKNLKDEDFQRPCDYTERYRKQKEILNLPLFPATTIGSFPQDGEVRRKRALFRKGKLSSGEYRTFIQDRIKGVIKFQEDIGLDVLVHGEFERTDMVEFFAQKLEGIATTENGWIISYGTRCYRPPVIYGDVSRPEPMTVDEIGFAQSQTRRPVKGMLTGPVTILAWSYVREDIPVWEVSYQIALCLQDEIRDYEKEGIKIIQIDEPAFREKAPVKKRNWGKYFEWAVKSFNLIVSKAKPETQIHTHMCYSEFGEIIGYILKMDFDVITIEASRSKGDIIEYFQNVDFKRQIGLGVWDIHSSYAPEVREMKKIVERALKAFPEENFWINPDCGLKTRDWPETEIGLRNLVELARQLRGEKEVKGEKI